MIQKKLMRERDRKPIPNTTYGKPQYSEVKGDKQRIELSRGCPHNCDFCYEPEAKQKEDVKKFEIPELNRNYVEILDMNFLWQPDVLKRIKELGEKRVNGKVVHYEEIFRFDISPSMDVGKKRCITSVLKKWFKKGLPESVADKIKRKYTI